MSRRRTTPPQAFEAVHPWQRIPAEICAECGDSATGFQRAAGVYLFTCDHHAGLLGGLLCERLGYGYSSGRSALRSTWKQWLHGQVYRVWRAMTLANLRDRRGRKMHQIFYTGLHADNNAAIAASGISQRVETYRSWSEWEGLRVDRAR